MEILAFIGASWWAWLIALGIAAMVVSLLYHMMDGGRAGCISGAVAGLVTFALIFGIMAGVSSYTTIQRGTVGLVSRFGALTGTVFSPGLHWKTPFIETAEIFRLGEFF